MSADFRSAGPIRKKRGWIIALVVLIAAIVLVAFHLRGAKQPMRGMPPQVVSVAQAASGDMPVVLDELGTVTPQATVTVLPQLSGYLTEVAYKEGQDVQKGQFLAQIDPRQYQINKQTAQAQLEKDQAVLAQARTDLERYRKMAAQQLIAEQTFADQQSTVQQAEATVKADKAAIAQADLDLAYCHITAPVSGRAGLRLVDVGNYVTASGSSGIVVITTVKPIMVQFGIPQNELGPVLQRFNGDAKLPVTVFNSDNSKQLATGTLYAIGNQMEASNGRVNVRATFANDDEVLFPNEFVNVRLLVDTLHGVVLVPTPAVQNGAPGDYVYIANADGTAAVQKVTLGPSDGKHTAILSGLKPGQTVVIDGMDRLSDGAKIKVAGAQAPGGNAQAPGDDATAARAGGKHGRRATAQS